MKIVTFSNKIRTYNFNKVKLNVAYLRNLSEAQIRIPKSCSKILVKDKIVSFSEQLYPEKYKKEEVKHDTFSKIFLKNRNLAGKTVSKSSFHNKVHVKSSTINYDDEQKNKFKSFSFQYPDQPKNNNLQTNKKFLDKHIISNQKLKKYVKLTLIKNRPLLL